MKPYKPRLRFFRTITGVRLVSVQEDIVANLSSMADWDLHQKVSHAAAVYNAKALSCRDPVYVAHHSRGNTPSYKYPDGSAPEFTS